MEHARARIQRAECVIARIDLLALWFDDLLDQDSFANLSTGAAYRLFFERLFDQPDADIHVQACLTSCDWARKKMLKEVLIGTRGDWWVPYAVLVTEQDDICECQKGGYKNTEYGKRLAEMFGGERRRPKNKKK